MLFLPLVCAFSPPSPTKKAQTARWMVSNIEWGVLSTTSSRSEGSTPGDAFGNPYSFADVDGVPYFYASGLDVSIQDINASQKSSLAITEAALTAENGTATVAACRIGDAASLGDPENPPCARLVLSGKVTQPAAGSAEETKAKAALFARHPSFAKYPPGHSFFVAKLEIDGIWEIDFYGGAAIIKPADYFAVQPAAPTAPAAAAAAAAAAPAAAPAVPAAAVAAATPAAAARDARPPFTQKAKTARWMAASLAYGVLSTTSTRTEATSVGAPFGNPYSFAQVDGNPYMYASGLDASMIDLLSGPGASPRASLALSEAALLGAPALKSCKIAAASLGDPENPPCARLVLSGKVTQPAAGSAEETKAKAALFALHPSFANYPPGHSFFVAKLEIDGIWLIDMFGGAAIIKPADYFAANVTAA